MTNLKMQDLLFKKIVNVEHELLRTDGSLSQYGAVKQPMQFIKVLQELTNNGIKEIKTFATKKGNKIIDITAADGERNVLKYTNEGDFLQLHNVETGLVIRSEKGIEALRNHPKVSIETKEALDTYQLRNHQRGKNYYESTISN